MRGKTITITILIDGYFFYLHPGDYHHCCVFVFLRNRGYSALNGYEVLPWSATTSVGSVLAVGLARKHPAREDG